MKAVMGRVWLLYLLAGLVATGVYTQAPGPWVKSGLYIGIVVSGAVACAAGLAARRDASRAWLLVLAAAALWAIGNVFWETDIATHSGMPPGLTSWRNFEFLGTYPLVVAALLVMLRRREGSAGALVDVGILCSAFFVLAWIFLIGPYTRDHGVTEGVKTVQTAFAIGDLVLAAAIVRTIAAIRPPRVVLLALGGVALFASDVTWNWASRIGSYTPGSWSDGGWLMFPVLMGAAVLYPRAPRHRLPAKGEEAHLSWGSFALLLLAGLVPPAIVTGLALGNISRRDPVLVGGSTALLALLVLVRMGLLLRRQERLVTTLGDQNVQLRELDRLKDDFVASVSHELRTPLTSIRGYVDLARDPELGELSEHQARCLAIVDRNADRILRVVSDLLFVAEVGAGKLELALGDVELDEVVAESAEAARPHAESKSIELTVEAGSVLLPTLRADRARLAQVIDNLVSNAIKFTPDGGRVSLRTFARGRTAVLEVADTGIGISPVEQEQLFERFYRTGAATENAIQGTGLGLTIVKAIVEAHGGVISVESGEGAGTTFRVELAVDSSPERDAAIAEELEA